MFVLSPYMHHGITMQPSDALPKAAAHKPQRYSSRPAYLDLSEGLRKPIAFPNPPRPPTPGPPRPSPPVPPQPPVPTPPPSPRYDLSCGVGPQPSILVSRAEPWQCPYPNPPPSPGPRRPGPVRPPPNVPTPPPSPRRTHSPWAFSTAASLADSVLLYLSLATWSQDIAAAAAAAAAEEHVRMAAEDDIYSQRHSNNPVSKPAAAVRDDDPVSSCQQADPEMPSDFASWRVISKEGPCIPDPNPSTTVISDMFLTALVDGRPN
ncbi:hypothetical protein F5X98DRAFT_228335 [Xylaria grammica]|nr:hypothetical protein F5X98DRAFT_228335 [Xylaria grammica]